MHKVGDPSTLLRAGPGVDALAGALSYQAPVLRGSILAFTLVWISTPAICLILIF